MPSCNIERKCKTKLMGYHVLSNPKLWTALSFHRWRFKIKLVMDYVDFYLVMKTEAGMKCCSFSPEYNLILATNT